MPIRRRLTWIIFAICALAVVEGLGWVTWQAVRLARLEREAREQARLQEAVVLALWRMDSELTPVIAEESRRPYFEYRSFYNPERTYTRMWQELQPGEIRVASELLHSPAPFIKLHFQVEPDGTITSPQAPTGNMRDLAESQYVDGEFIVYATGLVGELAAMVSGAADGRLAAELGGWRVDQPPAAVAGLDQAQFGASQPAPTSPPEVQEGLVSTDELRKSEAEFQNRQQVAQQAFEYGQRSRAKNAPQREEAARKLADAGGKGGEGAEPAAGARDKEDFAERENDRIGAKIAESQPAPAVHGEVEHMGFEPAWLRHPVTGQPELVLRRIVRVDHQTITQGIWLDWPAIRARLTERIRDLLPQAAIEPVLATGGVEPARSRLLASIPAVLSMGPVPRIEAPAFSATHATLAVTWLAVLGAIAAIGVVLRKSMALSDRRGRFVSAVTHELRTPLTTFCLYTEMLADGMVKDEASRRTYLDTLKGESRRLARIVENVLDYARLGQGRAHPNGHVVAMPAADLLARVRPVLERRAEQGGMTLEWTAPDLPGARCSADPQSVERILYNLVDNACKYAAESPDKRIRVAWRVFGGARSGDRLEAVVRDAGPGIPVSERRRVFRSFHRSRRDEHGPKTGLGLGLALSRALARELGGDLELVADGEPGAAIRLTLPVRCAPAAPVPAS